MNCVSCGRAQADGAARCPACGANAAPPSMPETYDLLPEEPPKSPAAGASEPPPQLFQPPGPRAGPSRRRLSEKSAPEPGLFSGGIPVRVFVAAGAALLLVIILSFTFCRTENKVTGRAKVDMTYTLQPNKPQVENFQVVGQAGYTLDVTAIDGELRGGVVSRSPKDPVTPAAVKKLLEGAALLKTGQSRSLTDELEAGTYSLILFSEGKKPVRAKVKFEVK